MIQTIEALDLTTGYPRSPNELLGGYVILARTIDKCRADIAGKAGEYHWNCGLAKMFFGFKGIDPLDFQKEIVTGKTDEEILTWVEQSGTVRSEEEILAWSYDCRWSVPSSQEMKAYIEKNVRETSPNNLYRQTFFQMLDAEEGRI